MTTTLRHLLQQRAARLQERPALVTAAWGSLDYFQLRNRVEGVALGIMAQPSPPTRLFARSGTPWDWISELATACCGLQWAAAGTTVDEAVLGGARFNDEGGRLAYHDQEHTLDSTSAFLPGLTHGELLVALRRLNGCLGWDHETRFALPLSQLPTPEGRTALWSALFAGARLELVELHTANWDPAPFRGLLSE